MKIALLHDPVITVFDSYGVPDAAAALGKAGHDVRLIAAATLATLTRDEADVLVIPYKDGTFTTPQLDGLVAFQAQGGGIVILGRMPHRLTWYPYRNSDGYRLHLTLGCGPYSFSGLSAFGKQVMGCNNMPDMDFFKGKTISSLRVSAYPPDRTETLFETPVRDFAWHSTPAIAVTRYSDEFLGSRFAMIPAHDGEPRENVAGTYQRDWKPAERLLTRDWGGIDLLVCRLADWCCPQPLAIRFDCTAVHAAADNAPLSVTLRSFCAQPSAFDVRIDYDGETMRLHGSFTGPCTITLPVELPPRTFGIHRYRAELLVEGQTSVSHETTEYVLHPDASTQIGYGFSTFWAFPSAKPVAEFEQFCREMKARGCQYVRVNIPWEDIEPEPARYDWTLPDAMLSLARGTGLLLRFWMFATTRGSGLGDAGVPTWSLREPAQTFDGRTGFFPTLWSDFYRQHYFNMVEAFARRYQNTPELDRLIIDFGNSDFPYGYFYYGGDNTIFDYSPQEQQAFRQYVRQQRSGDELKVAADLLGYASLTKWDDVYVPRPADEKAWRVYLDFRRWSVQQGIAEVESIIRREAPSKLPPDLPGHGAGSIADLSSYGLDAKKRHAAEEPAEEHELGRLHNAGLLWGGEAWQVGARYREYDDALFQSLRLNADYLSLPGVDLGVSGDDVARIGFIRRSIMGSRRDTPTVAIFDRLEWNAWQSLAQIGSRLDSEVDLLQPAHRHDFSSYKLLVLPPDPWCSPGTVTGGGGGCLVPQDVPWWQRLYTATNQGLNLLVFPEMVLAGGLPFRETFGLSAVKYGERTTQTVRWPDAFGGGTSRGKCRAVDVVGNVVVRDSEGNPLLVKHPVGKGAIWFAGYDTAPDSLDGPLCYEKDRDYDTHTLTRFLKATGLSNASLDSGNVNAWKSIVRSGDREFLLVFSHREVSFTATFEIASRRPLSGVLDLATGERFVAAPTDSGRWRINLPVHGRQGRYLYGEA